MDKHIVLISGSGSKNSHTLALMQFLEQLLSKQGLKTTIWDLEETPLPFTDPDFHGDLKHPNLSARKFINLIENADGVILGTPMYHGSFSGILKNALDNLGSDSLKNKPVGLISNAGGMGNPTACEHLRSIVRTLYGYALQTQIITTDSDFSNQKHRKTLINNSIKKRCIRMTEELAFFVNLMSQKDTNLQSQTLINLM